MALITPPLITTPFANKGDLSVVPATDPSGFVNYQSGYTPDYEINLSSGDPQAKAVERGVQNYLFNALTTGLQAWQTSNRPPWYNNMPGGYAQWAEVMYPNGDGTPVPYRSLVSSNTAAPGASANWEYIQGSGEILSNIPMPSGGAQGPGNVIVAVATDFNTFQTSGTWQFRTDAVVNGSPNAPANGGNAGAAGMLEVTAWSNGTSVYITHFFRDRNGLGFMRGFASGAWTPWKIWANANQFTVGEIRMWSGTASEAAVQAAWGPGWHLCNGSNGTPNLSNRFIIGAGSTYASGATGGSANVSLVTANLPAHNHTISIADAGHSHSITQTPHAHGVYDPGHAHGVYDPGHAHSYLTRSGTLPQSGNDNQCWVGSATGQTGSNVTNIGIYGNATGISISAANANLSVNGAYTGITASSANTGSGTAFSIQPPFCALAYVMYTGN